MRGIWLVSCKFLLNYYQFSNCEFAYWIRIRKFWFASSTLRNENKVWRLIHFKMNFVAKGGVADSQLLFACTQLLFADTKKCVADSQLWVADSQLWVADSQLCVANGQLCVANSQLCVADSQLLDADSKLLKNDSFLININNRLLVSYNLHILKSYFYAYVMCDDVSNDSNYSYVEYVIMPYQNVWYIKTERLDWTDYCNFYFGICCDSVWG